MTSVKEIEKLVKSDKDLRERKKEAGQLKEQNKKSPETKEKKEQEEKQESQQKKTKEKIKKEKSKMELLRDELAEIKGKDLEKEDIDGLIIKDKEPEHLWLDKKEEKKETKEKSKKIPFREGHWHKTEKQKKENKINAMNLKIEEKPLHPEEPEEKKKILEKLKETASGYKKISEKKSPGDKKIFEKGKSEEAIKEKKNAEEILPEKNAEKETRKPEKNLSEEEKLLKAFVLEKPEKKSEYKNSVEPEKKETQSTFQKIEYEEPEPKKIPFNKEKRMENLQGMIPVNPDSIKKEKKKENENLTIAQQLGSITKFFTKGLIHKVGGKEIDKKVLLELTKQEKKKVKKLVSSLEGPSKRYTKEEIIEAMQMEGHPKKIINAVIKIIYS